MNIRVLTVGPVACNCCVVVCSETQEAAVIDPGGHTDRILAAVSAMSAKVTRILLTHAHFDHILAAGDIVAATGASVGIHRDDQTLYSSLPHQGLVFGFQAKDPPPVNQVFRGGEVLTVGALKIKVLSTPGHTPGSVGYFIEAPKLVLFSGDTLFSESIGRTDVPGGSYPAIVHSIREVLYVLPGETRVVPGHGGETTIAHERIHNPFVTAIT